jgi:hypothetical protein
MPKRDRSRKEPTFAAELRDLLGLYDFELLFEDPEFNIPVRFIRKNIETGVHTIQFRKFGWKKGDK